MLRSSPVALSVKSHQKKPTRIPLHGYGYGKNYTRSYIKYANSGWGMGTYTETRDKRFVTPKVNRERPSEERRDGTAPFSGTTKTLSPHFRPFALADGGVLFVHPSSKEILTWSHEVLGKEQRASGLGAVHDETRSKIQALLADNTIEHVSIGQWRQMHVQRLMRKTMQREVPCY